MPILAAIPLSVRITDINYGNHLGNDALVGLIHEARVQWLHQLGLSELNIGGCGMIMKDLLVQFKAECFWGDQLTVELTVSELSAVAFKLQYAVYKTTVKAPDKRVLAASASTTLVSFSYEIRKVVALPDGLRNHLQAHLTDPAKASN